ncbi:MAG: HD domain-containing protein, partial [Erysipelothrix sp.]|nr:HD domain-containing protein [Erysipelothrix sp.]
CRPHDFVARIDGDEFLMLCPNTTLDEFSQTQESIKTYLRHEQKYEFPISLSFGSDIKVSLEESMDKLLIKAENDMYAHKVLHGQSSRNEAIMILFNSLIEKYEDERAHSHNVASYCRQIGEHLLLSGDELKELEIAGMMHDIGKITIPDSILHKPDILTSQEWDIMKRHTVNGYQILKSADKYSRLAEYALTHHERWDGKGYPNHLKGEEIPLFSRIIAVCDAYEAMTSRRVYKSALSQEQAISELKRCARTQFDPLIVDIFVEKVLK